MLNGSCHCGAVQWSIAAIPATATACNCTICRRYGALWAYGWLGDDVETRGKTAVYSRGDHEIGFHHCANCGCIAWWQGLHPHPDGRIRVAVNLRLADDPELIFDLPIRRFDGLDTFEERPSTDRRLKDVWF